MYAMQQWKFSVLLQKQQTMTYYLGLGLDPFFIT